MQQMTISLNLLSQNPASGVCPTGEAKATTQVESRSQNPMMMCRLLSGKKNPMQGHKFGKGLLRQQWRGVAKGGVSRIQPRRTLARRTETKGPASVCSSEVR